MHYQVKFPWGKGTRFGVVDNFGNEAKAAAKKGQVIVSDAVRPISYRVPEADIIDIPMRMGRFDPHENDFVGGDEYHEYVRQEFKKARAISNALPDGVVVGKLFTIGVADGQAYYVITKLTTRKATVEWRGFGGDRYYDHFFGGGRTVSIADAARYVKWADGMRKLFGKKSVVEV